MKKNNYAWAWVIQIKTPLNEIFYLERKPNNIIRMSKFDDAQLFSTREEAISALEYCQAWEASYSVVYMNVTHIILSRQKKLRDQADALDIWFI